MKYFVIDTTIKDGEYEYLSQSPISALSENDALRLAEMEAEDWTKSDYREFEVSVRAEVTESEYDIISKYIY